MRNIAKCKLCSSVIESLYLHDYVPCSCGEIGIEGGSEVYKAFAKNWENFLRIDDQDKEIIIKVLDDSKENKTDIPISPPESPPEKPARSEQIEMLDAMIKNIENLPPQAMSLPINHYDFYSFMLLISSILRN